MVKIYTKGNYLDFEAPIYMDDEYFKKFCDFLEKLTGGKIEIIPTLEKERGVGETEKHPVVWKPEELLLLLAPISNEELEVKLKRSDMSILMKRGQFVPEFSSWAKKKGYRIEQITATIIKKYLEEKDENS